MYFNQFSLPSTTSWHSCRSRHVGNRSQELTAWTPAACGIRAKCFVKRQLNDTPSTVYYPSRRPPPGSALVCAEDRSERR